MPRVLRGVVQHVRRQRALRPVGALMFFLECDAQIFFDERTQAKRLLPDELRGNLGIEKTVDRQSEIATEQAQVVVGIVENNLRFPLGKGLCEGRKVAYRDRVDDVSLEPRRKL